MMPGDEAKAGYGLSRTSRTYGTFGLYFLFNV